MNARTAADSEQGNPQVVTSLTRASLQSPMAECLLVRYATMTLMAERDQQVERVLMAYLDSCLRTKNEMVRRNAVRKQSCGR